MKNNFEYIVFILISLFVSCGSGTDNKSQIELEEGIKRYKPGYKYSDDEDYIKENDLKFYRRDQNHELKYEKSGDVIIVYVFTEVHMSFLYKPVYEMTGEIINLSLEQIGKNPTQTHKKGYQHCRVEYKIKLKSIDKDKNFKIYCKQSW